MYVWHTGSLTSSSPTVVGTDRTGGQKRRSVGRRSTTATIAKMRNGSSRMGSAVGLDRHRPEEFFVLGGQLRRDRDALLAAGEEDPGIGAPPENLLNRVARRPGGRQGHFDRLQELLEERIDLAFPGHRASYDIIGP